MPIEAFVEATEPQDRHLALFPDGRSVPDARSGQDEDRIRWLCGPRARTAAEKRNETIATQDRCCTIVPCFTRTSRFAPGSSGRSRPCVSVVSHRRVGSRAAFATASASTAILPPRAGYAEALLAHLKYIGPLLQEVVEVRDLGRLELHGPAEDLAKLREP